MKLKFLATGTAPEIYEFDGEKIIYSGESYDLSVFEEGDEFLEVEDNGIRDIQRIDGVLHVTLCQKAPPGHWRGIDEYIDSSFYNPENLYIKEVNADGTDINQKEIGD